MGIGERVGRWLLRKRIRYIQERATEDYKMALDFARDGEREAGRMAKDHSMGLREALQKLGAQR